MSATAKAVEPTVYYTKPLETWTFAELQDALGSATVAELLGLSRDYVRMLRKRGTANLERMKLLQDAVRADETEFRKTLVTIRATGSFQPRA